MQFAGKKGFWTLLLLGIGLLVFVVTRYAQSYATVTFAFEPKHGNVRLASTEHGDIPVTAHQPIRLKKGEYTLSRFGAHVEPNSEIIRIDGSWRQKSVRFDFTRTYLAKQYQAEREAIKQTIATRYPQLDSLYIISGEALYGRGEYFGAALTYRDQTSDQRDRLHILLEKTNGTWRMLSTPPVPILSTQDYPAVPRDILIAINQAR